MSSTTPFEVGGYTLEADRRYDAEQNLWVQELGGGRVRIGYDPLGAETAGDIVAISFPAVGTPVAGGEPLATVEAAKFVGPLAAPVAGVVAAVNAEVAADPGFVNRDPFGAWLVELSDVAPGGLAGLVAGEAEVAGWFAGAVERFRAQGAIAE